MKCARELLRDMPVMDKGEKAEEASGFDTGRKQDWVGRVSGGNAVLRKFQPGRRDFLKPKSPVRGIPRFTQVDLRGYPPVMLSHLLGAACVASLDPGAAAGAVSAAPSQQPT